MSDLHSAQRPLRQHPGRRRAAVAVPISAEPDRAAVQALVARRLALRLGVSLPVAAVVAQLAGLGPQEARR